MRLLREPLFHFLIIGSLLFVLFSIVAGPAPAPVNTISITPERVSQLAAGFESVRKRPPTDDELRMLVDSFALANRHALVTLGVSQRAVSRSKHHPM